VKRKRLFLLREIIGNTRESLQLSGTFSAPFPVKELYEIRHSVRPIRTVIGKKGIAYFGTVDFKIYCISEADLVIHLVEDLVHFRGFALFAGPLNDEQPALDIKAEIQDVFLEGINAHSLQILALLQVDITFTRDKKVTSSDNLLGVDPDADVTYTESASGSFRIDIDPTDPELIIHDLTVD